MPYVHSIGSVFEEERRLIYITGNLSKGTGSSQWSFNSNYQNIYFNIYSMGKCLLDAYLWKQKTMLIYQSSPATCIGDSLVLCSCNGGILKMTSFLTHNIL